MRHGQNAYCVKKSDVVEYQFQSYLSFFKLNRCSRSKTRLVTLTRAGVFFFLFGINVTARFWKNQNFNFKSQSRNVYGVVCGIDLFLVWFIAFMLDEGDV